MEIQLKSFRKNKRRLSSYLDLHLFEDLITMVQKRDTDITKYISKAIKNQIEKDREYNWMPLKKK